MPFQLIILGEDYYGRFMTCGISVIRSRDGASMEIRLKEEMFWLDFVDPSMESVAEMIALRIVEMNSKVQVA